MIQNSVVTNSPKTPFMKWRMSKALTKNFKNSQEPAVMKGRTKAKGRKKKTMLSTSTTQKTLLLKVLSASLSKVKKRSSC